MATIHRTTMAPTKLELLSGWLPRQPWYLATGLPPALTRVGGFRLDDPAGEVGIEFLLVTDGAGGGETTYAVPLTYRGVPLDGAEQGLIGTSEHGVLGTRWIYDAVHDPVAVAQLLEFICGRVDAQQQSESDTPDPSVGRSGLSSGGRLSAPSPLRVSDHRPGHTVVDVELINDAYADVGELSFGVVRVLPGDGYTGLGHIEADWARPEGASARAPVALLW
jgi:hypothetical protein